MSLSQELRHWTKGIRLYIGIAIAMLTVQIWWWTSIVYGNTRELMTSRLHEAYGWSALILLVSALSIGPLYKLAPRLGGAKLMFDARRLLGVGAAWFATLHACVAYFISFQAVNPLQLTMIYRQGFLLGTLALFILLIMAFTSFNKAMRSLGIWWFRVHRLIYAGATLAVWHALTIGVHASSMPALAIIIIVGIILFIAHLQVALLQTKAVTMWQLGTLGLMALLIIILSNYGVQLYIDQNSLEGHGH